MKGQGKKESLQKKMPVYDILLREDSLAREIVIVIMFIGLLVLLIINHQQLLAKQNQSSQGEITEQAASVENEAEDPTIDTTNWKTYKTQWYGFELKYPEDWNKPILKNAASGAKWEYRYQFRKQEINESNLYIGFDVVVYNVGKVKEISNTDEFPAVKNEELKAQGFCEEISGRLGENERYPAEQIYIPFDDDCYNPAYFYTLTRDDYIYNIVPILTGEEEKTIQTEKEIIQNFPEFIAVSSTFNLIDIVRPNPTPVKPKITAPKPVSFKKDSLGRMVCAKKNDKPAKSDKNKGKHLDMECCLDPDEYPNPWCYYPPEKYGKLLNKLK